MPDAKVALLLLLPLVGLAGCDKPMPPAEQKRLDDRAVAQVEAMNHAPPPLRPVTPQPLPHASIAHRAEAGASCAFVLKGGGGVFAVMAGDRAELSIDGKPAVFARDAGSTRLPSGVWSRYIGKALALLVEQPGAGSPIASLVINDPYNRPVYQAAGSLRCPAI